MEGLLQGVVICACARRTKTNEFWRIWAKQNEPNEPGKTGEKTGIFRQKRGKKRANKTKAWRNRAKPKVSPNFDSGLPLPALDCTLRKSQGTVFPGCHLSFSQSDPNSRISSSKDKLNSRKEGENNSGQILHCGPQTRNRSSCSLANLNRPHHGLGSEISLGQALICKGVCVHFGKHGN